jgi:hypothetical protein
LREGEKYRNGKVRRYCEEAVEENNFLWKDLEKWSTIFRRWRTETIFPQPLFRFGHHSTQ